MDINELNKKIDNELESVNDLAVKGASFNFQPLFLFLHLSMLLDYYLTKDSFFFSSFHSQMPLYFYGFLIVYMTMLRLFAKSCNSPGFANDELQEDVGPNTDRFFCKYCNLYAPIRASHCHNCKKCVIRRDHHCPWTNICVGRDNHVYFFFFSFFEFFSQTVPTVDLYYHFIRYLIISKYYELSVILPYVIIIMVATYGSQMSFRLASYNFNTIYYNLTTWERARRSQISYLKCLPEGYSPFDKGIVGNLVEFFTMKEKKMKWEIPPVDLSIYS